MKKNWINIHLFLPIAAHHAAFKNLSLAPVFSNNEHCYDEVDFSTDINKIFHQAIDKKETQSFQLPK